MAFSFKKPASISSKPEMRGGIAHMLSTDPFLDWAIILAIAVAAALILVATGVSVYLDAGSRLDGPVDAMIRKPALPLDKSALGQVLSLFAGRAGHRSP